jgi:hypothetical protein
VQYAKGLGVNAASDVALYLGGNCSRFTATVGVDDDVSGTQRLDLVTGDGGDGNGLDHGDWADAKLVCR